MTPAHPLPAGAAAANLADDSQDLDVFHCPLSGISLIEASAGTGKTWNICGLVLRLLLERPFTVQQILVVTFTNAATAELRERVRNRLVDTLAGLRAPPGTDLAAGGDPFVRDLLAALRGRGLDDADMVRRLDQALQTFDEAAIFTIHGFCQRALADTPFTARMPLVLDLLADDSELLMEAVHDFWRQRVAGEAADPLLAAYLLDRGDTPDQWARLLKRQLAKPLSRLLWPADLDGGAAPSAQTAALQAAFDTARQQWAVERSAALAAVQAGLPRLNGTTYKKDALAAAAQDWDALLAADGPPLSRAGLPPKLALLGSRTLQQRAKKDQQPPAHPFFDNAQALLDALDGADRALRLARLRLLRDLLVDAAARLRQAKRQRRVVAFDDMLFNLYERLVTPVADADGGGSAPPPLAAALRARFPAALIDEFQDTDPLQFAVFHTVYGGAAAQQAPLFLVGDPKQAIYSFRHADLHTYLQARDQAGARYTLRANQRATRPLIDALNRLFGRHPQAFMQPGLHYQPVAFGDKPRPLLADRSAPRAALQVWTLPTDARSGQPLAKPLAQAAAAATCAGEITRLLAAAMAGDLTLGARPLRAGDIAVLVRSHAQGGVMRQALAALGVGSVELSQASVFHSPDAEELERVLAAVLQPARDGLLKAALATRWLGWTADRVAALADDEAQQMAWVQRLAGYLDTWRQRGVGVMLRQWLHAEQVDQRLLAQADGPRRLTNLLHLAEALHQAAAEHPAPEALLRWLQAQRDDPRGDEAAQLRLESDQNLVQIVTIHKSKGLEYPVVFCPFLWDGRAAPANDGPDGVAGHDAQGRPVVDFRKGLDDDFDEPAAKAAARLEAAAETLRLVYVALTRAVQRCYLVAGNYRARAGRGLSPAESGRSLLNWLVAGDGLSPEAWFDTKRTLAEPAAIEAAWAALADPGAAEGTPPALAVAPLPAAWRQPLPPPAADAEPLQALTPPAPLPTGWWIGSYSSLAQGAQAVVAAAPADAVTERSDRPGHERAGADHDLRADLAPDPADGLVDDLVDEPGDGDTGTAPWADPPATALAADDILRFPRGAAAGECVHAAFEHADFTDPATWPAAVARALREHHPAGLLAAPAADTDGLAAMLLRLLGDVLHTPLPVGSARPLQLATVTLARRRTELEFHLPVPQLGAAALNRVLARQGYPVPRLEFGTLRGYLKGFIDLVFEHDGRYFIADWKSNHLGETATGYGDTALADAMTSHNYHLQSLLYSVALQRWLQRRLPGYTHERHFGGVLYLFVRGVRPGWSTAAGAPAGLHFHCPEAATLDALSGLLAGAPA